MLGNRRYCYPLTITDFASRYLLTCEALLTTQEKFAFIEDQQVFLDEQGLGHHGTRAAGTGEPGDRRQEVEKQDDAQPLRLWRQDPLRAGGPSVMASDRRQPTVHCCARSRSVH
jgi:hypothetical protein